MQDMSVLSEAVMELMDSLEETEAEIRTVAICVELEDAEKRSWTRIYCNDGRQWYQAAFLEQALDALTYQDQEDNG